MEWISLLSLVIIAISLLYLYQKRVFSYWDRKSIPCLKGAWPIVGNVHSMIFMRKNMSDMYKDFYNAMRGRSMVGFYNMKEPALLIRDPELVKCILSKNFPNFEKNLLEINKDLDPLFAANAFFAEGEQWKTTRQQLSAAFTSGKLKYMYESIDNVCVKLVKYLHKLTEQNGGKIELEMKELFSRFTAEAVASAAFGVEGGSFESEHDGTFKEMGRRIFEPSLKKGLELFAVTCIPWLSSILRIRFMPLEVDQFFRKIIRDVIKHREEEGIQRPDFIQLMIQLKNSHAIDKIHNEEFNDDIITSHATSFFADGYETSSITLSFLAYQLAAHPDVQERLRDEINAVVAEHGAINYEALQSMPYLDRVMMESMRLTPAFGALLKVCTKQIELVGSDGLSCVIEPGVNIIIPTCAMQQDPEYWSEPDKFDPERFTEENKESRHKFLFLPFGGGPRNCPGQRMAIMQMKAAIATVVQKYKLEVSPRTKLPIRLDPRYFIMAAAVGGLWINMKRI